jgi:hypothetical protein
VPIEVSGLPDLETRILKLKQLQAEQVTDLKDSFARLVDSVSPSNLFISALNDVAQSPGLRTTAIHTALGIGAGNKIFAGHSKNIFKSIPRTAVWLLIANFVRKKIPQIKEDHLKY